MVGSSNYLGSKFLQSGDSIVALRSLKPLYKGHMEKQEMEMKLKLETEMGTKDAPITGAIFSS